MNFVSCANMLLGWLFFKERKEGTQFGEEEGKSPLPCGRCLPHLPFMLPLERGMNNQEVFNHLCLKYFKMNDSLSFVNVNNSRVLIRIGLKQSPSSNLQPHCRVVQENFVGVGAKSIFMIFSYFLVEISNLIDPKKFPVFFSLPCFS